jgi:hypothetical protein
MSHCISGAQLKRMSPLARQVMENEHQRLSQKTRARKPRRPATHCHRGHELKGKNLRLYRYERETVRVCVACLEMRQTAKRIQRSKAERKALALLRKYGIVDKVLERRMAEIQEVA